MLRATTACTFSTSQVPKVVRTPSVFNILTWKCASRHNGVQFFISHLASWLGTRRFSELTFRPSGAPNHWKNTVFGDFPTFSRICIFFLLTLSLLLFFLLIFLFSLPLPCSAFHLSILSEVFDEYKLVTMHVAFFNFRFRPQDTFEERLPQCPEPICLGKKQRQMCSHPFKPDLNFAVKPSGNGDRSIATKLKWNSQEISVTRSILGLALMEDSSR